MPIYEYQCAKCNHEFELLVRAGEQPACPDCGDKRLEKQLSVPAAHGSSGRDLPMSGVPGT